MKVDREQDDAMDETGRRSADALNAHGEQPVQTEADDLELPRLARRAVETYVCEHRFIKPSSVPDTSILFQPAACFVTIKTEHGDLRGCIGTIEPTSPTLAEEIIANAVSAATRDPRFFPVADNELPSLRYSVDVLMKPEPTSFEDLDPTIYGVIVESEKGMQRGLLLPAIEGIETAEQQVQIAARKAGIVPSNPLKLYRFRVRRFREPRQ